MISRRSMMVGTALGLAGCTAAAPQYTGPEVTRIQVFKKDRVMQLIHNRTLLKAYRFDLGFAPDGHKFEEGDGRTPEGAYRIDRRNPNSRFHLSLGISYPNATDIAAARARGVSPGGDIFIHGGPRTKTPQPKRRFWQTAKEKPSDWTAGCIAVTDREIEEIYAMISTRTPIRILP